MGFVIDCLGCLKEMGLLPWDYGRADFISLSVKLVCSSAPKRDDIFILLGIANVHGRVSQTPSPDMAFLGEWFLLP